MSKLAVLLALYAALVGTGLLIHKLIQGPGEAGRDTVIAEAAGSSDVRALMGEARGLLRDEVKGTLKNIDWRLARMEALRRSMDEGLQATQRTAEEAAQQNYGMLESMKEDVQRIARAAEGVDKILTRLEAMETRVKAVEDRPAQIVKEVIRETGGAPPPKREPVGPKRRELPKGPKKDPALIAKEVEAAKKDLMSDDVDVIFPAIEKVRLYRVLEAAPRLMEILGDFKDEFGRAAAASALGDMKICDAVPALAEALIDKSDLVAAQANRAIRQITGFDTELGASAGVRRRRAARNKVREWWRGHEAKIREDLGQPRKDG